MGGGVWFYANNGKFPVDGGDAAMISFEASKERNLSRLWDSSDKSNEKDNLVGFGCFCSGNLRC